MRKPNPYESQLERQDSAPIRDGQQYAKGLIAAADKKNIPIEEDPEVLRETVDLDLGAQVPPQVYAVVAGVMDLLRKLEDSHEHESESSQSGGVQLRQRK